MAISWFSSLKKTKLKAFFFFLVLAIIFWMLTKFTREYTATVQATINYTSLPETVMLAQSNKKTLSFDVTANGFDFMFYKINTPQVNIEILRYYSQGQKKIILPREELVRLISSQLEKDIAVKNLSVNELVVKLDAIIFKKIKVYPNTDFTFKEGFKAIKNVTVKPDSVLISGPSEIIGSLDSLVTQLLSKTNVSTDLKEPIGLKNTAEGIKVTPSQVEILLSVAEFSQQQITVPVQVINLPPGVVIKLVPDAITIFFDASLQDFTEISEKSFQVICDYSKRNVEENFMIPELVKKPDGILHQEFDVEKIDFLKFK